MRSACATAKPAWQTSAPLRYELTKGGSLKQTIMDLSTFLLLRGPFAWIGHGWIGCVTHGPANETQYMRPASFDVDYGEPLGLCAETSPGKSAVFTRKWSKTTISVDCNKMEGSIDML